RATGDRTGEARTLLYIGVLIVSLGQRDSALAYTGQALSIYRAAADRAGEANSLDGLGGVFFTADRPDSALAYYRQALPIRRALEDQAGEAATLSNIATVFSRIGRLDSAVAYLDRSTALSAAISKRTGSEFNQLSYNEASADRYVSWALTWLARAPHGAAGDATTPSVDSVSAAYAALAASERGRARALLDLMRDTTAHVVPGADFPAEGARLASTLQHAGSAGLVYL